MALILKWNTYGNDFYFLTSRSMALLLALWLFMALGRELGDEIFFVKHIVSNISCII